MFDPSDHLKPASDAAAAASSSSADLSVVVLGLGIICFAFALFVLLLSHVVAWRLGRRYEQGIMTLGPQRRVGFVHNRRTSTVPHGPGSPMPAFVDAEPQPEPEQPERRDDLLVGGLSRSLPLVAANPGLAHLLPRS